MGISRTIIALVVLFVGIMTLLVLRYDPWLVAAVIDNPLITVPLVAVVAALLGVATIHRVPEPKRAVVFYEERFDRIDPRGRLPLLPGVERIGAEIPLDEQRVLGWPVVLYDKDGKEQLVAFGLTWRLVPQAARPQHDRERRILLMTNAERQAIVLQTLESILRDITRSVSLDELKDVLSDPDCIEAIRERLCERLDKDTLTVDRLHMLRVGPSEKKDDPKPARETHSLTQTRDWRGEVQGAGPNLVRGLPPGLVGTPGAHQALAQGGQVPAAPGAPAAGSPAGANGAGAQGGEQNVAIVHEEIKRVEEVVRGAKENGDVKAKAPKDGLEATDHAKILAAIIERLPDVTDDLRQRVTTPPYSGTAVLEAAQAVLPLADPARPRISAVLRTLRVLDNAYLQVTRLLADTVDSITQELPYDNPPAVARALKEQSEAYKKLNDTVLTAALALAAKLVQNGTANVYSAPYYQQQLGKFAGVRMPPPRQLDEAVQQILRAAVNGVLVGFLHGTMIASAITQSPQLAAILAPEQSSLTAQDCGVARAVGQSAAALARHFVS
jgi:hypothetical protein